MRDEHRLILEAETMAEAGNELARFNAERARVLGGVPPMPGRRMPLPFTGVGGDLSENAG